MSNRDEAGRFLPGNRFWEARSTAGPKPKFTGPEPLWAACVEYFEWVEANPLWEDKLVTFQGAATHEPVAKMRAMTIAGLCLFLDIEEQTWRLWRSERSDLLAVIMRAEAVIRDQKFSGAAADLLNPNIIARDLGLADRTDIANPPGETFKTEETPARERVAERLASLAARAAPDDGAGPDTSKSK